MGAHRVRALSSSPHAGPTRRLAEGEQIAPGRHAVRRPGGARRCAVPLDVHAHRFGRGSSAPATKVDAVPRISLARRGSRFSARARGCARPLCGGVLGAWSETSTRTAPIPTGPATRARTCGRRSRPVLRRLGTDHIDLSCVHIRDPAAPLEETIRSMTPRGRKGPLPRDQHALARGAGPGQHPGRVARLDARQRPFRCPKTCCGATPSASRSRPRRPSARAWPPGGRSRAACCRARSRRARTARTARPGSARTASETATARSPLTSPRSPTPSPRSPTSSARALSGSAGLDPHALAGGAPHPWRTHPRPARGQPRRARGHATGRGRHPTGGSSRRLRAGPSLGLHGRYGWLRLWRRRRAPTPAGNQAQGSGAEDTPVRARSIRSRRHAAPPARPTTHRPGG